jgi:hypothetical protein
MGRIWATDYSMSTIDRKIRETPPDGRAAVNRHRLREAATRHTRVIVLGTSGGLDHFEDGRLGHLGFAGALVAEVGEAVPHGLRVDEA